MLGCDLFELNGNKYMLTADYFSKFFIVRKISSESSRTIIQNLKTIFSEHGIPNQLLTDNGPCYASREFQEFTEKWQFTHTTSSPMFPQSNGFIERIVGTVKSVMKKCGEDTELALLFLRTTPVDSYLPSPAELLYDRRIRSTLPFSFNHKNSYGDTKEILKQRQQRQKLYHDQSGAKELSELTSGTPIMLQDTNSLKWRPATVVAPSEEPRSYIVRRTEI